MGSALVLALADGESPLPTKTESWCDPSQLGRAHADEEVDLQSICDVATDILYLLSGRRFGVRTETVRPFSGARSFEWLRYLVANSSSSGFSGYPWSNIERGPDFLYLKGPVQSITSVKVDGRTLDPSEYLLYDSRKLLRTSRNDESTWWPMGQDLGLADSALGTFSITYSWGTPVPEGGKLAAQVFASELCHYIFKEPCALPDRAVSITRQGVSQTILDPSQFLAQARTGLYLPDAWLSSVNPRGMRRRPTISSPESIQQLRSS